METGMTRRELGAALAAGAAFASETRAAVYGGPLADLKDKVHAEEFDPMHWTGEQYKSAPLRLTFRATDKTEAEIWQRQLRTKLTELVGGFPERVPLHPLSLDVREFPGYRREKFVFESRQGVGVLAYLLTPRDKRPPFATVICIPGHGRGVDDIVGIDEKGNARTEKPSYQYDFAIQMVEHGLAAVAIEPMAFGCRRDAATEAKGMNITSCEPTAGAALLFGQTMIGWRVWDVMRTIDWIETRPELAGIRIGCAGISGGGTITQFASALEPRIKAAMVSGYLNTFHDSIMSMPHCVDNYVPGILNWAENYDVASLIAPRFFFSEGGTRDPIFPVHATRAAFAKVKLAYAVFGVPERAGQEIFEGDHVFHGEQGLPFLAAALG
jgi:dienelactone hydrolase